METIFFTKNSLKTKFIFKLQQLMNELVKIHINTFRISSNENINLFLKELDNCKKVIRDDQNFIKYHFPDFLNEYQRSEKYQDFIILFDVYKKELKNLKTPNISCDDEDLKNFYKIFDDKSIRLPKNIYTQLRDSIKNKFYADLETVYLSSSEMKKYPTLRKYIDNLLSRK